MSEAYYTEAKVGKPAPNFEMEAVLAEGEGLDRFGKVSLEEIKAAGKWTVLYFYPLDFTFVCPTEIKRFNELYPKFKELGAELVACSCDSVFSHLAWQDRKDLGRLEHPHASDKTGEISAAYGIYDDEKGVAWRGTFIIDPEGTLKAAHVNHGEGGRNVDEVLRTLEVFKNEAEGKLVPCGWTPGKEFLTKG
ncbi:peroxiredoxin [Spirochaeta cellobiosiphila]|uniref:peroxiredoxin n=1 Tax=Spirochaeta cellobiosiphila TaxID=504483 RepID=UPI0004098FD1|nr:peroxiredoxin [Spirochaeta cellobiosiphila]